MSPLLRRRDNSDAGRVGMIELFFDLVFVFAVTQLRLKDSTVTGNDGAGLGVDVAAGGGLITVNTTCGLSGSSEPPYTPGYWGVCSGD